MPAVLRPPTTRRARVALVAGAVAAAVLVPIAVGRDGASADGGPVLAVYGDSYSAGGRQGGKGDDGWPAIVADHLDADLRLHAAGGAGYVNGSQARDETFLDQVQLHPEPQADVVVVFGSRNDRELPAAEIKAQAAAMYDAVRTASPSATVVVIGPQWDDDVAPREMYVTRDAVRSAAVSAGVLFVDALQEGWLFERPQLIGTDGVHPNDVGHAYLASLIEPLVRDALLGAGIA